MRKTGTLTLAAVLAVAMGWGLAPAAKAELFADDLVGFWKFDDDTDASPDDVAPSGVVSDDCTLQNGAGFSGNNPPPTNVPFSDFSLDLDDDTDEQSCQVTFSGDLNFNDPQATVTVAAWVYVNNLDDDQAIWQQIGGDGRTWLFVEQGLGEVRSFLGGVTTNDAAATIATETWAHVAVTLDKTVDGDIGDQDGQVTIFINGVQVAQSAPDGVTFEPENQPFRIGGHKDGNTDLFFDGQIDEVRVYNRALSEAEIALLHSLPSKLYLSDSNNRLDGISILFDVSIVGGEAILTPLPAVTACGLGGDGIADDACGPEFPGVGPFVFPAPDGVIPFEQVDALAATPDGSRLYAINKDDSQLGYYDILTAEWHEGFGAVGDGSGPIPGIVLAAFGPGGQLYVASEATDSLYEVNLADPPNSMLIGAFEIDGGPDDGEALDLLGADFAVFLNGDGPTWLVATNSDAGHAPGVYAFDPTAGPPIPATFVGPATLDEVLTGMASSLNGFGVPMTSQTGFPFGAGDTGTLMDDNILEHDPTNAEVLFSYPMIFPYVLEDYEFGDMSNGPLALCENRTRGYWTTHTRCNWKGGNPEDPRLVSLCSGDQLITFGSCTAGGDEMISDLKGNSSNLTQLLTQLVAAILNCQDAGEGTCVLSGALAAAEAELCSEADAAGATTTQEVLEAWETMSPTSVQNDLTEQLDAFNNQTENEAICEFFGGGEENGGPNGNGPPTFNSQSKKDK